jgi:hypothetical protein
MATTWPIATKATANKPVVATAVNVSSSLRSGRLMPAVPHFKHSAEMRSEFQFLQSETDETEFIDAFVSHADALEKDSPTQWFFRVGDCRIQFLRSRRTPDEVSIGRIALATHGFGLALASAPAAEALFTKMRKWLKKRYSNRPTAENVANPASVTSYRIMWLGPDAKERYRSGGVTLRTISRGPVIIKEEAEQAAAPNRSAAPTLKSEIPLRDSEG